MKRKVAYSALFLLLVSFVPGRAENSVAQWDYIEITLEGSTRGNPFTDVSVSAVFSHAEREKTVAVEGFYDGEGVYKVRFMPDQTGEWNYIVRSNDKSINGVKGRFECVIASPDNNGPVKVNNQYHFSYANGEPYVPVGTTCYAWLHQEEELQEQTLESLSNSPFNKLRMTIFPKKYPYNETEPFLYPYEKGNDGRWDLTKFNPEFFRNVERRILDLQTLGIEADIILFHPYDQGHWGFDRMSREEDHRYLRYVIARFAAFRNVWWSAANEYEFMRTKSKEDWEGNFKVIQERDPYNRLTSIHNAHVESMYDHSRPYITHVSIQSPNLKESRGWKVYGKPVINDECEYEGNLHMPWGNITAQELVHRAWLGYGYGIYVGHGETYEDDIIWWSHGGVLKGESPPRLAFLKEVMLETSPAGLHPLDSGSYIWTRFSGGKSDRAMIYYFGEHQPAKWPFGHAEENKSYSAEIIDTWNMTIQKVEGTYKKGNVIPMPGKPYLALRFREVE